MRQICYLLVLIIIVIGCGKDEDIASSTFKWPTVSSKSDSAIVALERGFIDVTPSDSLFQYIKIIEREAENSESERNLQLLTRAHFWKARIANRDNDNLRCEEELAIAEEICDSTRYLYDYIRIQYLASIFRHKNNTAGYYCRLKEYEKFATSTDDNFLLASLLTDIGHVLVNAGLYDRALANYLKANEIYKRLGIVEYQLKNKLNVINILEKAGRYEESRNLCVRLLNNEEARLDTNFYNELRLTAFVILDNPSYLIEGYKEILNDQRLHRLKVRYDISLGYMYIDAGKNELAIPHLESLLDNLKDVNQSRLREYIYRMAYMIYNRKEIPDSIIKYLELTVMERGVMLEEGISSKISAMENQEEIHNIERLADEKLQKERIGIVMMIVILIIITLLIIIILMRRSHQQKLALMETRINLESNQRKAVTTALAMAEKDNMLETILDQITALGDNKSADEKIRHLQQDIKLHLSGRQEWEDFQKVFEEVHPSFAAVLKSSWPSLSEGDIRLAMYIRIGLSTKQIARMLLLQPDSVKKNRQRLRRHMGLSQDENLEDIIRSL